MAIKTAVSTDKTADRKDRPKPTMRENVSYNEVPAHGVTNPDREMKSVGAFSFPQTRRGTIRGHRSEPPLPTRVWLSRRPYRLTCLFPIELQSVDSSQRCQRHSDSQISDRSPEARTLR